MLKLASIEKENMELWMVEVYRTERPVDYRNGAFLYETENGIEEFWDDEMYITIEKAIYLVDEDEDADDVMSEYIAKYKDCEGYTVTITRMDENHNRCGAYTIK